MAKRVLVSCGDQYHPADIVMEGLARLTDHDFAFECAPDGPLDDLELDFAVIILAKSNACSPTDPSPWLTLEFETRFREFVKRGGGLPVVHSGTVGFPKQSAVRLITGGAFVSHPEACEVNIKAVKKSPVSKDIAPFTVHDEHYFVDADADNDVFLQSQSDNGIQPAGWTRSEGEGRVCVITPGHFAGVWEHPGFLTLIKNALKWVANE